MANQLTPEYLEGLKEKYQDVIKSVESREDFLKYLKEENNTYSFFILGKFEDQETFIENCLNPAFKNENLPEVHHIIPTSCGGPNLPWNRIMLFRLDHIKAHRLRSECYGETIDELAMNMLTNVSNKSIRMGREKSLLTRQTMQVGIHDPLVQRASGKKGGAVKSLAKDAKFEEKVTEPFLTLREQELTFFFRNESSGKIVVIPPNTLTLPKDIVPYLHAVEPFTQAQIDSGNIPGGLAKVYKGQRASHLGWQVKVNGISASTWYSNNFD